jgi:hypothetical protein
MCWFEHAAREPPAYARAMLHEFVTLNREELIARCKGKVLTRSAPSSIKAEVNHGVPMFLDELVEELRVGPSSSPQIGQTAARHGRDLLRRGYTVAQVVLDYGDVCQAITEMAVEVSAPVSVDDFRVMNRCLDNAIAGAVTEYGREQKPSVAGPSAGKTGEAASAGGTERLQVLAHDLRSAIFAASGALEAIKSGGLGINGSTGTVLDRSLLGARTLIDRLLVETFPLPVSPSRQVTGDSVLLDPGCQPRVPE